LPKNQKKPKIKIMKSIFKFLFLLIFSICIFSDLSAQVKELQTKNKKALKHFEQGKLLYESKNDDKAKVELKKAIAADPQFIDPYMILGVIHYDARDYKTAADFFKKAIDINPKYSSTLYYSLGSSLMNLGIYEEALRSFKALLQFGRLHADLENLAKKEMRNCEFAVEAIKNPVPFHPKNLGAGVNSNESEYFPAITADEQVLLFTRNRRDESNRAGSQEDFYISMKENGQWQKAINMGPPINTPMNEGAPTLSADGQALIFTACEVFGDYGPGRKGYGSCDIFFSKKNGNQWSKPQNIGAPVNSNKWDSQPSYSSDGRTLYFVSSRPGGFGDADIWVSLLNDEGVWGEPQNLGLNVNSPEREESVFIHPDNQTLYFASNGHPGMGGMDLYVSKRNPDGSWGQAINLGFPINTHGDENSLLVGASGTIAYFASDREGGLGGLDIYSFELPESSRPQQVTYMKGKVFDKETLKPLEARFELVDLESGKLAVESFSNSGNGEFLVCLPTNKNYALNAFKNGYLFYSENFSLKGSQTAIKPTIRDVPLQPIKEGEIVILKNVFFEIASADLKIESKIELDKLVTFLKRNTSIKIEIGGHTDNVGDKKYNLNLSNIRCKAVVEYLIDQKVDPNRLSYKGYGEAVPVADNNTEEGRTLNRRTEFKITSK
jgi:outer membrane protein OmpA-like peptidoglycan-associated protein/tetratricopeptide (TPR) repeat protein